MEQKKEVQVRTRFVAWLCLILLLPFCVIVGNLLYTGGYRGAVSLLLFMWPFAYISLRCFMTHKSEFFDLITHSEIRIIYVVCFVITFYVSAAWGWNYGIAPFISALVFFVSEPRLPKLPI